MMYHCTSYIPISKITNNNEVNVPDEKIILIVRQLRVFFYKFRSVAISALTSESYAQRNDYTRGMKEGR